MISESRSLLRLMFSESAYIKKVLCASPARSCILFDETAGLNARTANPLCHSKKCRSSFSSSTARSFCNVCAISGFTIVSSNPLSAISSPSVTPKRALLRQQPLPHIPLPLLHQQSICMHIKLRQYRHVPDCKKCPASSACPSSPDPSTPS